GALDAADGSDQAKSLSSARATQGKEQCAFSVAAIREAFEELGVLLAYRSDGSTASQADLDTLDRSQDANFLAQLQQRGLRMAVDQTYWLCQWVTDRDLAKRFDA
ncbi:MAG: MBL fold metallo-hydrolase, partial [Quisquiliibacterium sp.]